MKKLIVLTMCMVIAMFSLSSFIVDHKNEIAFNSSKLHSFKAKAELNKKMAKRSFRLGTGTYDDGNGHVAFFNGELDFNTPATITVSAAISGDPGYAVLVDGIINYSGGYYFTSGVTIYYFGGGISGSFTVPDGAYQATS